MAATNEIQSSPSLSRSPQISDAVLVAGIALSSFGALLLELALTRLFSVVLFYHFAFLAISIALLGLGAGGVFAHIRKQFLNRWDLRALASFCALLSAAAIPLALLVILHLPVSLKLTARNFIRLSAIYMCSAVPFFLTGLQFSVIFARQSARIPGLYSADLAGGAVACLAIVPLLNWIGGPNAVLAAALVFAIASLIWAPASRGRTAALAVTATLAFLMVSNHSGALFDIIWAKGIRRENVEFARWNAISRVEVDRAEDGARLIVIDADANTFIMNADPKHWNGTQWQQTLMATPPALVNVLRPHGDYAIIGPGGGVDVLRAVANGSPSVTGIELNPLIANTIMRGGYADFAHHLYELPEVHIHESDGRSFIRSTPERYDAIQMTLVDTWASTAAGAFALSENNLYTSDAFREYFDHLKPDGMIAITRWEFQVPREALRVVSVGIDALHKLGVTNVSDHFIVVAQDELDEDGINVAVLAKKSPFTAEEEAEVRQHVDANPPLNILYSPSNHEANPFSQLIQSNDPGSFSKTYPYNVSAVTDNAPFFFFTLKPENIFRLHTRHSMDWKVNLGIAVLAMLLVISIAAVLAFLILPLLLHKTSSGERAGAILYFVAIGLGYILVEVTFIQRFVLFLGHPTYALTVVVFLMMLSSGAGSLFSRRWSEKTTALMPILILIPVALLIYVGILPQVLNKFVGFAFWEKLLISALILVPLGFLMGTPFPTGLRLMARGTNQNSSIEWAWAMNAASSVLGSVLAIVIALQCGLNVTLACGAAAYVAGSLLTGKLRAAGTAG